ncbi:MAG: HPr family phosphocarrier protein [Patescibacteria group bacterium]|nr:HPr family phosphocarrier protein [Patescibacteria group bacterium]
MEIEKKIAYEKRCKVGDPRGLKCHNAYMISHMAHKLTGKIAELHLFIRRADNNQSSSAYVILQTMLLHADYGTELIVYTGNENFKSQVDELAAFIESVRDNTPEFVPKPKSAWSFLGSLFRKLFHRNRFRHKRFRR